MIRIASGISSTYQSLSVIELFAKLQYSVIYDFYYSILYEKPRPEKNDE